MQTRCFQCNIGSNAKIARSWKYARNICSFGKPENTLGIEIPNNVQPETTLYPLPGVLTTIASNPTGSTEPTIISTYPTTISSNTDGVITSSSISACSSKGLTNEMCQMTCSWDGACEEIVNTTQCGCNQTEHKSIRRTAFLVSTIRKENISIFKITLL